jgi:hypothetical protein
MHEEGWGVCVSLSREDLVCKLGRDEWGCSTMRDQGEVMDEWWWDGGREEFLKNLTGREHIGKGDVFDMRVEREGG